MSIAFTLLSLLIALFPVLTISDGIATQSLFASLAAIIMTVIGVTARAADVQFVAQVTRRLGFAMAIPAIWMTIQLLPVPFLSLSHTIWINSNEALDQKAWGHISIDLGKTFETLAFYLANMAVILACIFLARDHHRAGRLYVILGAVTLLTVLALLIDRTFHLFAIASGYPQQGLGAASALGLVLSLAIGSLGIERHGAKKTGRLFVIAGGAGILISAAGLAGATNINIAVVAVFGATTFLSIQLVRGLELASWTIAFLLATLLAAAAMIIVWRFDSDSAMAPLLQFATAAPANSVAVAQRLLPDSGWFGTGAGSYDALLPIYQDLGSTVTQPPSTATALAVELGMPMTLVVVGLGVWLIVRLYSGALTRGRDWFYSAAAASGAVILIGEAFCDASLLHVGIAATGDVLVGVGLAQSVSRADKT